MYYRYLHCAQARRASDSGYRGNSVWILFFDVLGAVGSFVLLTQSCVADQLSLLGVGCTGNPSGL